MKRINLETKVGLFFVVCFGLIAFISLRLGNYQIGEARGYTLSAVFDTAAGLNPDTPVLMAGIRTGIVHKIELEKGRARVYFKIREETKIPNDSQISVQSRGFLGAKYLEIAPGKSAQFYKPGDEMANAAMSGELSALTARAGDIADDVKAITTNLRKVFGGEEGREGIQDVFMNLQEITQRLAGALADNQERMNQIAANIERLTGAMAGMTEENRKAVGEAIGAMPAIAKNLQVLTANLANLTQSNNEELNQTIKALAVSSQRLTDAMTNIASITGKIDAGQGTVGALVSDKQMANNVSDTIDTVNDFVARIRRIQLALGYRGEYYPNQGQFKSYVTLRLQPALDHWYEVGIVDDPFDYDNLSKTTTTTTHNAGTKNQTTEKVITQTDYYNEYNIRFNAQFAKRWYWFVVHGGLIENTAGVGTDLKFFDDHLTLSLEVRDFTNPNNPQLKAGMDFMFLDHFFLTAGADDIVNKSVLARHSWPLWFLGAGFVFTDEDFAALITRIPLPSSF